MAVPVRRFANLPDRSTPLTAEWLNGWGDDLQANAEAAESARDEAVAAAATATAPTDTQVAALIGTPGSSTQTALRRRFVVFGDSWTTTLDGVNIPAVAIAQLGGVLVKNHGVAGAQIGPTTQNGGNTTDAQITAAQADATYSKATITDVLVLGGVNNIGGYLPTVDQAAAHIGGILALYPNARGWYVANSKKAINNAGDSDPWRWYARLLEGAALGGLETAPYSPMWNWGQQRSTYWPVDSVDTARHMAAAGQTAWAKRLAAFLSGGDGWRPFFKVTNSLHSNATALVSSASLATDDSVVDGTTLRLNCAIGGMDSLSTVPTDAYQAILQIPTGYCPIGNYMQYPAGCRLSSGTMDWTYSMRVSAAGVVEIDPRLLNAHVGFFVLRADLPLTTVKTA